jgi:plexin A
VKHLFDFFEDQAARHGIADPGVAYSWKNNSLPLLFWVNMIKNPEFILDVDKSATVDSCLSVIAQTFMDACSMAETKLGKDSPSNKLLFARDLPRYREMFSRFYSDVRALAPVSDQELAQYLADLSKEYSQEFNVVGAIREFMGYVIKYSVPIMDVLSADPIAVKHRLHEKLANILNIITQQTIPRL